MKKKSRGELEDTLAMFIFFSAGYLALNLFGGLLFDILGISFFLAGIYGLVALNKRAKYIF